MGSASSPVLLSVKPSMQSPPPPPPHVQDVLDFLTSHGFARAASALRDDVVAMGIDGSIPPLLAPPPVRVQRAASSSSSSSSGDFVSMGSSLSELMNPYGVWSPARPTSEDSSATHSEFETAREYNNPNIFGDSGWYDDHYGGYLRDPFIELSTISGIFNSQDKFVMSIDAEENFRHEIRNISVTDKPEIYSCSFPLCDCCNGNITERNKISNSSVYGRYQIMADETEILDECGDDECQLKKVDECQEAIVWKSNSLYEQDQTSENSLELDPVEKEPQMNGLHAVEGDTFTNNVAHRHKNNRKEDFASNTVNEDLDRGGYSIQVVTDKDSHLDVNDVYEFGPFGTVDREIQDAESTGVQGEDHGLADDLQLYRSHEDEYEIFELRIVHRKNRTGFEENKDFPIVLNSVIAGRYYVTEYLGSAAFSRVVQAHDLQTEVDVCLKIIKNNKDFFDQSLDEIKLLKFVNKHDPADLCHILRLYDYFYHQEHLFIVCELLRANLYEFQKYNQDSGGEVYFTLPRIQAIARQCLEALEYLHHLRIIHCDLKPENILIKSYSRCEVKIIDLGSSCFQTDNLCLYVQSRSYRAPEVIIGLPYDEKIDIWSLGCILAELYTGDVLFPNESLVMMLTRMIGILGPIGIEMLSKGQETHKYFTDDYDLYHKNEETGQVEYLRPEKSSLAHHLQTNDAAFLDFVRSLLQINPKRRPTASQALEHRWLSVVYS